MRYTLHLPETSTATTQSNKTVDLGVARQAAGRSDEMRGASFSFFRLSFAGADQRGSLTSYPPTRPNNSSLILYRSTSARSRRKVNHTLRKNLSITSTSARVASRPWMDQLERIR